MTIMFYGNSCKYDEKPYFASYLMIKTPYFAHNMRKYMLISPSFNDFFTNADSVKRESHECSHLCLPNPTGCSCACQTGFRYINETHCAKGISRQIIFTRKHDIRLDKTSPFWDEPAIGFLPMKRLKPLEFHIFIFMSWSSRLQFNFVLIHTYVRKSEVNDPCAEKHFHAASGKIMVFGIRIWCTSFKYLLIWEQFLLHVDKYTSWIS